MLMITTLSPVMNLGEDSQLEGTESVGTLIGRAFYRNQDLRASVLGGIGLIGIFGLMSNVVNILVFFKLWSKDTVNISLLAIAVSDLIVCITTIGGATCELPHFQDILLHKFHSNPSHVSYYYFGIPHKICERITLILTAFIMVERCVCVTIPLKVRQILTRQRVGWAVILCYALALSSGIPIYCIRYHDWVFYPPLNKSIFSVLKTNSYDSVNEILIPVTVIFFYVFVFIIIIIATSLLIVTLLKKSNWRQKVSTVAQEASSSRDIPSKERKISKMLVLVASLFVVCNTPCTFIFLLSLDPSFRIHGQNAQFYLLMTYISFLFVGVNSSSNAFIYYTNSSNYKDTFDKIFNIQKQNKGKGS